MLPAGNGSVAKTDFKSAGSKYVGDIGYGAPGDNLYAAALPCFVAAIDETRRRGRFARQRHPALQTPEPVVGERGSGFDLNRMEASAGFRERIHLQAEVVAPEEKVGGLTAVKAALRRAPAPLQGDCVCCRKNDSVQVRRACEP